MDIYKGVNNEIIITCDYINYLIIISFYIISIDILYSVLYYVHVSSHPILCSYLSYLPTVILVQSNLSWQILTSAMADAECKMQSAQMHFAMPQYYFWTPAMADAGCKMQMHKCTMQCRSTIFGAVYLQFAASRNGIYTPMTDH